jgi:uncharacterized protein (TIGR03067 family)
MRVGVRLALVVLAVAHGIAMAQDEPKGGEVSEAVRAELARHAGTWRVESMVYEGEESDPEVARSIERVVEGERVVWRRDGKSFSASRIEIDPGKDPATIDVIPEGGPARGKRVLGIYELEGDRMTICMAAPGGPRPKRFEAGEGSRQNLMVLVRAGPAPER